MNIGKLYQIKKHVWYLYPSKDIAALAADTAAEGALAGPPDDATPAYWSDYLSKEFKCNISYISENSIFCLLGNNGNLLKVLSANGELGWIIYPQDEEWNKGSIEEVKET